MIWYDRHIKTWCKFYLMTYSYQCDDDDKQNSPVYIHRLR